MKLTCSSEKLKTALVHADRVTGKNLTLPLLSCILIIVSGKTIKIRATNLSLGIEIEIPAQIEKEGVIAVSGSVLSTFFTNTKTNETVLLETKGDILFVTTKQSKVQIKTFPYEDFPTIPIVESNTIILPTQIFISGIESVYYACAQTDIKPEIASVLITPNENQLVFVATDSFRLAEKKISSKGLYGFTPILLPFKNIVELLRILNDYQGDLEFRITKNQLSISFNGYYITSRLIDGSFPDYQQIIPKNSTTEIIILKSELQNALKTSTLFTDKLNQVTLTSNPENKKILLSAKNTEIGEQEIELEATLTGKPIVLNLNYRYILDCLNILAVDSVVLKCTEENKPIVLEGIGDNSFVYLVMPMNR